MNLTIPDELLQLKAATRRMVEEELQPHDQSIEETGRIPPEALDAISRMGLCGSHTPKSYGGMGLDMLGTCLLTEEMARANIAYFYTYSMNVHIASKALELHGSDALKDRWLPELASGRVIGCFALTEAEAGSDAASLQATAVRDGDHYVLNGCKRYITNAPIAGLFNVYAVTGDSGRRSRRISAFLVERDRPGLRIGRLFPMAAGRGSFHAEVVLEDCAVPVENRLGAEGDGFAIAMQCLDAGRLGWAAYSVGAAEQLLEMAVAHVTSRQQFGRRLADNQGVQWMLADMAADLQAARLVTYDAAWRYELEPANRTRLGAMAKLVASEMVGRMADRTLQLFGGEGYVRDRPIERIWREVRVIRVLEGTSEIMRHIIARELLLDGAPVDSRGLSPVL